MEPNLNRQNAQFYCKITIDYDVSIRCIDLENILTGFRMLCQYELAEKTKMPPRTFTSVAKIQSIEKGSIDINLLIDLYQVFDSAKDISDILLNGNLDFRDYVEILYDLIDIYLNGKEIADNYKTYLKSIISTLPHFKSITIQNARKMFKLWSDENGKISLKKEDIV